MQVGRRKNFSASRRKRDGVSVRCAFYIQRNTFSPVNPHDSVRLPRAHSHICKITEIRITRARPYRESAEFVKTFQLRVEYDRFVFSCALYRTRRTRRIAVADDRRKSGRILHRCRRFFRIERYKYFVLRSAAYNHFGNTAHAFDFFLQRRFDRFSRTLVFFFKCDA